MTLIKVMRAPYFQSSTGLATPLGICLAPLPALAPARSPRAKSIMIMRKDVTKCGRNEGRIKIYPGELNARRVERTWPPSTCSEDNPGSHGDMGQCRDPFFLQATAWLDPTDLAKSIHLLDRFDEWGGTFIYLFIHSRFPPIRPGDKLFFC